MKKKRRTHPTNDPSPGNIFQAWMQLIRNWPRPLRISFLLSISLLALTGATCGLLPATTKEQAVKWVRSRLHPSRTVVVGSMDFPEQITVGEIIAQILEAHGIKVERNFRQSSELLRQAIEKGNIDCYLEYTGVPYTLVFHQRPTSDPGVVYNYVREHYAEKNIEVSKPFHFQTEWAILIRSSDAQEKHVYKISEAVRYAPTWRLGYIPDFETDPDALDGLKRTYNLNFKSERMIALPYIYDELEDNRVDIISGSSTDGELLKDAFQKLEDDLHHFPPYEPIVLARREALERVPELRDIMARLPETMTLNRMRMLNEQVRRDPKALTSLVQSWLKTSGLN